MVDIFLVHSGDTFELLASGRLVGRGSAEAVDASLRYLPPCTAVILDLSGLTGLDQRAATALVTAIDERRRVGGCLSIACPEPAMRELLAVAGLAGTGLLHESRDAARRSLADAFAT